MSIEYQFPEGLPIAANACRAWKQLFSLYGGDSIYLQTQKTLLQDAIEACPAFLCGDVVVIHRNGTITWGHAANIFDMNRETAVRGTLFLFNEIHDVIAACLQMDAGPFNTSLYHSMDDKDFFRFLRKRILPVAFGWYTSNYGHTASPDTTPLYITDENFDVLEYDNPIA